MSIKHIFETSHSEVFWQIERVPILTGAILAMAASALKCYSQLLSSCFRLFVFEINVKRKCVIIVHLTFLTYLIPTHPFSTPGKHQKTFSVF